MADDAGVGVLDASVVVKTLLPEDGTAESVALMARPVRWVAPRLMVVEVASVLRRKVEGRQLSALDASAALAVILDAIDDGVIALSDDEALAMAALNLALSLGHKVPDCLYLALAEREGAFLASADNKLLALAGERGIEVAPIPPAPDGST